MLINIRMFGSKQHFLYSKDKEHLISSTVTKSFCIYRRYSETFSERYCSHRDLFPYVSKKMTLKLIKYLEYSPHNWWTLAGKRVSWWWRGWDCERTTHSGLFRRLENPSQWSGMYVLYLQPITYILKIIQQCLTNKTVRFLGLFFTIHLRHSNNMNLWENTEYNFKCPEFSNKIANTNIGVLCLCIYVKSGNRCYIFSKIFNMDDNILVLKPRKKKKQG